MVEGDVSIERTERITRRTTAIDECRAAPVRSRPAPHGKVCMRPPAMLFGIPIDDVTMAETLELIEAMVVDGRKRGTTHQIATVNVDFLVNALGDARTREILQHADLCIADGMPVVWGSTTLGMPIRERVAGADLVPLLVNASRTSGWHVHVFGSSPVVAEAARSLLHQQYPGARFSIDPGPVISDVDDIDDDILRSIDAVGADILCVALGNPKQERFIAAHRDRLKIPVMIGVGGSLDLLVGKRRRAPTWVQRMGMEWVVRTAQEPRRLGRRYAHDFRVFGPAFVRQLNESRRRRDHTGLKLACTAGTVSIEFRGDTVPTPESWGRVAARVLAGAAIEVQSNTSSSVSDAAIAQLVGLVRLARRSGGAVIWHDNSTGLRTHLLGSGLTHTMLGSPNGVC